MGLQRTREGSLTEAAQSGFMPLVGDPRPEPQTPFDFALQRLLDDLFAAYPTWATQMGFHAHDDRWPECSSFGREARLAMLRHHRARLEVLADGDLDHDELVDRGIVLEAIDALEFQEAELREAAWDPLSHVRIAGNGLFNLLAREYAPWRHRGAAFAGRLRGLPGYLESAADALTGSAERPVSLLHTETALGQLEGLNELIDQGLAEAERQAGSGQDGEIRAQLVAAAGPARAAVAEFRRRLSDEIRPRAAGEGRLGPRLFEAKLHHTLASDLTHAELERRARRDYDLVRAEMARLARAAWADWMQGEPLPEGHGPRADDEVVRRVLDAIARDHPGAQELLDWCTAEVRRLERFCADHGVIGVPDEPLKLTWTPVFMRAYGGAFLDSPGPLDKGMSSYFWITPPAQDAPPDEIESYMREDNARMLRLLCIHEGVPGHYLQGAWANRSPRLARAVFASGMFAEGWAVYVTQVMMDAGYGEQEPALMLTHWKFYLRAVINSIIDVAIHTAGMSEDEALRLMVEGGFQEEHEARAKWLRARLTSTQLSTYYVGSIELWDLEVLARQRAALAVGASAEAVPAQTVVGGLGATPGFDHRAYLEAVVSHGTPPVKWLRRILLGEARGA
jgi:uncharacterized protein (DUF885 family)